MRSAADATSREPPEAREFREAPELLRGSARFTDDYDLEGAVHVAFVRSQYAHARLDGVDVTPAIEHDGVLVAFSATDLDEVGAPTTVRASTSLPGRDVVDRPLLARNVARYTGDPVAVVVAEDRYTAADAVDAVRVEYDRLPAVVDPEDAADLAFPSLTDEESERVGWGGGPTSIVREVGDERAVDRAIDDAPHVVSTTLENQRLAPVPLEPRTVLAEYHASTGSFTVRTATQTPHADRDRLAETLGVSPGSIRVVAPAVGGGFGTKGAKPYPEEPLVLWVSRHLDRPAKWTATRTEGMQTDHHGRDVRTRGELAIDDDGRIRALRVRGSVALGAYPFRDPASCLKPQLLSGAYRIPQISFRIVGVLTNTTPLGSYRGAGRPESIYAIERLIDRAAATLGVDPAEFRRQNFVEPCAFPYETPTGAVYDSGDYEAALDRALDLAEYATFRREQSAIRDDGRYVGIGIASFVENTGSSGPGYVRVELHFDGSVTAYCGSTDQGQGHATTFAGLIGSELGVPPDSVTIEEGDTRSLVDGTGTFGSRSAPVVGGALVECAREVIEAGRRVAAAHLESAERDVRFTDGEYHVRGSPHRAVSLKRVATISRDALDVPGRAGETEQRPEPGIVASTEYRPDGRCYAFGTHVAVVEVDVECGRVDVRRYVAVDDCGTRIDPRFVTGQVHGGVGQGIGQALYEAVRFDDNGTLLTGSLQEYAVPRAADMPEILTDSTVTPSPLTPHGAKGIGEAGTIAAPPAIANAVADALAPLGVDDLDMPLDPEGTWRAIARAERS